MQLKVITLYLIVHCLARRPSFGFQKKTEREKPRSGTIEVQENQQPQQVTLGWTWLFFEIQYKSGQNIPAGWVLEKEWTGRWRGEGTVYGSDRVLRTRSGQQSRHSHRETRWCSKVIPKSSQRRKRRRRNKVKQLLVRARLGKMRQKKEAKKIRHRFTGSASHELSASFLLLFAYLFCLFHLHCCLWANFNLR